MTKTILITGATDGIGLETARRLAREGHRLILHGRNPAKLDAAVGAIAPPAAATSVETVCADLSDLAQVEAMADGIVSDHEHLDVIINNAGVLKAPDPITPDGLDLRFVVNTIAPWVLTRRLLPLLGDGGRVLNLSSAAQATVDLEALAGRRTLGDMDAYSQSKLAITMWTRHLAEDLGEGGPIVVAVNPGSLLATKMVKSGFGIPGNDLGIGADILVRAALSDEFEAASGAYWDNDAGRFADPHPDALDPAKVQPVVAAVESLAERLTGSSATPQMP